LRYPDLDIRGRTYLLPAYLALRLRAAGIRTVWISGWTLRSIPELTWMVSILKRAGLRVVFDPIDPICEFLAAMREGEEGNEAEDRVCIDRMRAVYQQCDLVMSVTPELQELLVSNGAPSDRMLTARWTTDGELFHPARCGRSLKQRLGLSEDTFLAGWLGTMEPFKGLLEVILPMIEESARNSDGIHFVIAGRGSLEPEVRKWIAARDGLPVTVLPSIPYAEAPDFTASLDAYLVPTNPKTMYAQSICPIKCFDALAMGTPLVLTRTRATGFLTQYGKLVSFADFTPHSFLEQLHRVRDMVRSEGRPAPCDGYSHQRVSVEMADALENLFASKK
ncbi:MAG TPA: glycosyltransferase, partial [Longimicrobiales bacterium]